MLLFSPEEDNLRTLKLRKLSHADSKLDTRMIYYPNARPVAVERLPVRHSLGGTMMKLPLELLHIIFSSLEFESLGKLRLVNYAIKQTIEGMPAFRCMVEHASTALRALREGRLISEFSAAQLYNVLRTNRCVGCRDYGPYLLLPTIERCCFNCLTDNLSMRVISTSVAASCFALSGKSICSIPRMYSISGEYDYQWRSRRQWLLSTKMVREFAVKLHGGEIEMYKKVDANSSKVWTAYIKKWQAWLLARRFNVPSPERPLLPNKRLNSADDPFRYMASTPFPSLDHQAGSVERGLWCQGCSEQLSQGLNRGRSLGIEELEELMKKVRKAFSKQEMFDHVDNCPGAQSLWSKLTVTGKSYT